MNEKDFIVLFTYSRAQAIADGVLVDVTKMAKEAGFVLPVAMTSAAWHDCVKVPVGVEGQDEQGRLWDVLWMLKSTIFRTTDPTNSTLYFQLHVRNDNRPGTPPLVRLKACASPNDDGSLCITVMLPEED